MGDQKTTGVVTSACAPAGPLPVATVAALPCLCGCQSFAPVPTLYLPELLFRRLTSGLIVPLDLSWLHQMTLQQPMCTLLVSLERSRPAQQTVQRSWSKSARGSSATHAGLVQMQKSRVISRGQVSFVPLLRATSSAVSGIAVSLGP